LESQQNDNIAWSVSETSLKQEKLKKRSKSTKCYIHFHNFPESSAKNFNVVSHLKVSQISKIKSKRGTGTWNPSKNDNIPRSVGETSLKQEKLRMQSKSTKCYIHFHNFPESSAKDFNVVSRLQVSQIPKIKSK